MPNNHEHQHQAAIFQWAKWGEQKNPELGMMFAIPNGAHLAGKDKTQRARNWKKLEAEGARAGVPDICLPVASSGYHGLFIELKAGNNKATPKQREWLSALQDQGYRAECVNGGPAAIELICDYLGIAFPV